MPDSSIMNTFLTLTGAVLGLAIILFITKKAVNKSKSIGNHLELKVISKVQLHSKTFIYTVKAGTRTLLIGASDHAITTLADLSPQIKQNQHPSPSSDNQAAQAVPKNKSQIEDALSFRSFIMSGMKKREN